MTLIEEELTEILRKILECHKNAERRQYFPESIDTQPSRFYEGQASGYKQAADLIAFVLKEMSLENPEKDPLHALFTELGVSENDANGFRMLLKETEQGFYHGRSNAFRNSAEYISRLFRAGVFP